MENLLHITGDCQPPSVSNSVYDSLDPSQDAGQCLSKIPVALALTPVKGKGAFLPGWQSKRLTHDAIQRALEGRATGYGLITGGLSGGVLAIDVDGPRAASRLQEMSGGELPHTPAWTSGQPGRRQIIYQLSPATQARLQNMTRHVIDCGGGEQLDFRYNRCQSVLPPSAHPDTGHYRWIVPMGECAIADAPQWLETYLLSVVAAERKPKPKPKAQQGTAQGTAAPVKVSDRQLWGDRPAPGRISADPGLMTQWNALHITGKTGRKTNDVLLVLSRLLKDAGLSCADALNEFRHFATQIPGYAQYSSADSRRDIERSTRVSRIVLNWYRKDPLSGYVAKRDTGLNERRAGAAQRRIVEAVQKIVSDGLSSSISTVRGWIEAIQKWCVERWGIKPHRNTLYKHLELWHPDYRGSENSRAQSRTTARCENIPTQQGIEPVPTPPQQHPRFALLPWLAVEAPQQQDTPATPQPSHAAVTRDNAVATEPSNVTPASPRRYQRGDRVVVDDHTGAPYCGKEATITAVVTEGGVDVYRLDITYTGRRLRLRQRKGAVEALGCFLSPVGTDTPAAQPPAPEPVELFLTASQIGEAIKDTPHWLHALCGAAQHRIQRHEVDARIWAALVEVATNA